MFELLTTKRLNLCAKYQAQFDSDMCNSRIGVLVLNHKLHPSFLFVCLFGVFLVGFLFRRVRLCKNSACSTMTKRDIN